MLYLVATPIGSLSDITLRAIDTLKSCDYILCEDTRHSLVLLKHYAIHKPVKSYHKFNEASQLEQVAQDLREGKIICLISDAGTPGISDPGSLLVRYCNENNIPFTAIPGPCAAIQALSCSALSTDRFQFYGFLPKKESELKKELQSILSYRGTTICYESPHRLVATLEMIKQLDQERQLVVARELTKKFEEIHRGKPEELLSYWSTTPLKGEIVLLIDGSRIEPPDWSEWSPQDHVKWVQENYGITLQESIKLVAELRHVPKRQVYNQIHHHRPLA